IILEDRNNIDRIYVKEFQEIDLGEWDNKTFKYIKSHFPHEYEERGKNIDTFIPKNGESFYQLQNRVMPIVNKILETKDNNILIVAHAGVNRVIISNLLKIPLKDIMGIYQPYACINKLFWNSKVKKWEYELITMGEEVL
ncbi:MAG: histidine phosphatase family protein, partial [Clostridiales bacterium]|nr:histidine phosphatase family protein [Clostridiales bacterium]